MAALEILDPAKGLNFQVPKKCIHHGEDVTAFQASKAYADIMTFIFQLNIAMLPREGKEWPLDDTSIAYPPVVQNIANLLQDLTKIIDEAPPEPGPRRFGNISFRKWNEIAKDRVPELLEKYLPKEILAFQSTSDASATTELEAYLLGSFGSAQRLDYGTGHELSFLAFLGCLWKLGAFPDSEDGSMERSIVLGIFEPYLVLVRRLILTYTLEPAGSHGVWGLDDHSFLPYIFGSAQLSPSFTGAANVATEGSIANAPDPTDVARIDGVERQRRRNLYFSAIGFIYDVKKGPFWEHSPILYDISGVTAGWAKINKGMIKMYNAEVLSKFPVVQHFVFGSLFSWDKSPESAAAVGASAAQPSVHIASHPKPSVPSFQETARPQPMGSARGGMPLTAAPWASTTRPAPDTRGGMPMTAAPWASTARPPAPGAGMPQTAAPWASTARPPAPDMGAQTTRAPWAGQAPSTRDVPSTRAPWAAPPGAGDDPGKAR